MPRRQTFLHQRRGRGHPVLLVDGGDCFFSVPSKKPPSPKDELVAVGKARTLVTAYNILGYDAMGLGPADLQLGVTKLQEVLAPARFSVLCANLVEKESRKPVFEESTVIELGGVRFGLYGVVLSSLGRGYKERILEGKYELLDAVETTKKLVPKLRERADMVIGISHINVDDNETVTREAPGVDIIIDPFSRSGNQAVWITEGQYVVQSNGKPIIRIDGQGSRVGVFEMFFQPGKTRFSSYAGYDYPLEPQIFPHPEMEEIVRFRGRGKWWDDLPADYDPRKVRLLDDQFLGDEACGACHEAQYQFWAKTKHASAYSLLLENQDQLKYECIECHTVAYGVTYNEPAKVGRFKNVQCESCHATNPGHPADPKRHHLGKVNDTRCWGCHNPLFTEKNFNIVEAKNSVACPKMEN